MIRAKYQLLSIFAISERSHAATQERESVRRKDITPTSNGFFRNREVLSLFLGKDAMILSTSISNPLINIRKIKPVSAKKSRIWKLISSAEDRRNCPIKKPAIISTITAGILFNLRSDNVIGTAQAMAATIKMG